MVSWISCFSCRLVCRCRGETRTLSLSTHSTGARERRCENVETFLRCDVILSVRCEREQLGGQEKTFLSFYFHFFTLFFAPLCVNNRLNTPTRAWEWGKHIKNEKFHFLSSCRHSQQSQSSREKLMTWKPEEFHWETFFSLMRWWFQTIFFLALKFKHSFFIFHNSSLSPPPPSWGSSNICRCRRRLESLNLIPDGSEPRHVIQINFTSTCAQMLETLLGDWSSTVVGCKRDASHRQHFLPAHLLLLLW